MHGVGMDQVHIAVKTGTRVPARAAWQVFQADFQEIILTVRMQEPCHICVEGVVAQRPLDHEMSVDTDLGLAHRAVEQQGHGIAALTIIRYVKMGTVPALAHVRQAARTSGMRGYAGLEVLRHLHFLQVVAAVKRTGDGPVVRHGHRFPGDAVAAEFPLRQQGFLPRRVCLAATRRKQQQG